MTSRARGPRPADGVHLIVGEKAFDSFLAERELERILEGALGPERSPDAVQVLRGDEVSWGRVLEIARTGSLFSDRRAIVVRGAEALKGEAEGLTDLLASPPPGLTLVFLASRVDKRRSAWKRVAEAATVVKAEPLKGASLRRYVAEELRRRRLALAGEALEELIERVGQDLRRLIGELDKLEAFAEDGQALSPEQVAAVLGRGLVPPFYLLGDAVAARDRPRVLELVEALLEEGEEAVKILATLHRSLRQLRGVVAARGGGVSREEMLSRLGIPPQLAFKLPALIEASRRWREPELARAFAVLGRADRRLKTGADPRAALSGAVMEALGESATTPSPGR